MFDYHEENVKFAQRMLSLSPLFGYLAGNEAIVELIAHMMDSRDRHWSDKWTEALTDGTIEQQVRDSVRRRVVDYLEALADMHRPVNSNAADVLTDAAEDVRCEAMDITESCSTPTPFVLPEIVDQELRLLRPLAECARAWQTDSSNDLELSAAIEDWRMGMKAIRNKGMGKPG